MMLLQSAGFKRIFISSFEKVAKIRRSTGHQRVRASSHGREKGAFSDRRGGLDSAHGATARTSFEGGTEHFEGSRSQGFSSASKRRAPGVQRRRGPLHSRPSASPYGFAAALVVHLLDDDRVHAVDLEELD